MSYEEPTSDDRETLLDFYDRLRDRFDREMMNLDIAADNLKTDFDRFLNPENHTEWSPPFPPMSRREFRSWGEDKRKQEVRAAGREHIQETMEDAALLAHMHDVELGDIEGLEQSDEAIREKIQRERSGQQAKVADY
jgi:hypothetical protein